MKRRLFRNGLFAAVVAVLLIGTAVVSVWAVVTSGLLSSSGSDISGPLAAADQASPAPLEATAGIRVAGEFQISQPRDPFRPLITEDSPIVGAPGVGVPGTEGAEGGFAPGGTTVALVEVREVSGVARATITVDGESFDVGVGDTFVGVYKVVSIDVENNSAVILFGDNAFELSEGQQILK
jgi:hypothetical protein